MDHRPAIGTRVRLTDTKDHSLATVAETPSSFWSPATHIRQHPPGIVWVEFDSGGGAPWGWGEMEEIA